MNEQTTFFTKNYSFFLKKKKHIFSHLKKKKKKNPLAVAGQPHKESGVVATPLEHLGLAQATPNWLWGWSWFFCFFFFFFLEF
jgi:hypothetical protein